jgi:hypothetical protein
MVAFAVVIAVLGILSLDLLERGGEPTRSRRIPSGITSTRIMKLLCIGRVAEWFKAAVLKPAQGRSFSVCPVPDGVD